MNGEDQKKLRNIKAAVGQFHTETRSNSLTDFIVWIDCKMEYEDMIEEQQRKLSEEQRRRAP